MALQNRAKRDLTVHIALFELLLVYDLFNDAVGGSDDG